MLRSGKILKNEVKASRRLSKYTFTISILSKTVLTDTRSGRKKTYIQFSQLYESNWIYQEVERYLQPRNVVPKVEPNSKVSSVWWNRTEELGKLLTRWSQISIEACRWQERYMSYSGGSYQCQRWTRKNHQWEDSKIKRPVITNRPLPKSA